MKNIISKFKELKNRYLDSRIYRHYYVDKNLLNNEITLNDLSFIDPDCIPRLSFSLKHHLKKIF